jgi:hypothetical protein
VGCYEEGEFSSQVFFFLFFSFLSRGFLLARSFLCFFFFSFGGEGVLELG